MDSLTFKKYQEYVLHKCLFFTSLGITVGGSTGYMKGNLEVPYASRTGMAFGLFSSTFFTTSYILKELRQVDDYINHTVSGAISTSLFVGGIFRSSKVALACGLCGGLVGGLYSILGNVLYDQSKAQWIDQRLYVMENSKYKVVADRARRKKEFNETNNNATATTKTSNIDNQYPKN